MGMLKLRGNTFLFLLLRCGCPELSEKPEWTENNNGITRPNMLADLIRFSLPDYEPKRLDTLGSYFSKYLAGDAPYGKYLPFQQAECQYGLDTRIAENYPSVLREMDHFCDTYIKKDSFARRLLIGGIVDTILDDDSFVGEFNIGDRFVTREELNNIDSFHLQSFLISVWNTILKDHPDTAEGIETYNLWASSNGYNSPKELNSDIGAERAKKIRVSSENCSVDQPDEPYTATEGTIQVATDRIPVSQASINNYFAAIHRKYDKLKTLLYNDIPHPFYDFYVCNTIVKRTQITNSESKSFSFQEIKNATPFTLAKYDPYIIIEAYGGMGKSMMMRHFLLTAVNEYSEQKAIPLFIQLRDYPGGASFNDLRNYIYSSTLGLMSDIPNDQFEQLLLSGKCLVLLDGLDELTSHQDDFEKALDQFMDAYPDCQYIMSSRPFTDFISFTRFSTFHLSSFTDDQALLLIDKLEYREDDKSVKQKFVEALKTDLFETHHDFTSNPLLLTIMLMTFGQVAEISKTMHIFYRDAYSVLSQKHDASKGAYKRQLKTKLSSDQFSDFFAEFCARSYTGAKYAMTPEQAASYYDQLNELKKHPEVKATSSDFLYDLCANMCLMFFESGQYHFTHRSFQEYFCALYFSKQKDKQLRKIGNFFENSRIHYFATSTFSMLYEMIPEKIQEYIFMPFLDELFAECESNDGFWHYLKIMYGEIYYSSEKGVTFIDAQEPKSFLVSFIVNMLDISWQSAYTKPIPEYEELVSNKLVRLEDDGDYVDIDEVPKEYIAENGMPEIEVVGYSFKTHMILEHADQFKEMVDFLSSPDFPPREEYEGLKLYQQQLHKQYDKSDVRTDDLFDSL